MQLECNLYNMLQDIQRILDLKRGCYFYQPPLLKTIILSKYNNAYFLNPYPHHAITLVNLYGMMIEPFLIKAQGI
jgi:hypothetical protein